MEWYSDISETASVLFPAVLPIQRIAEQVFHWFRYHRSHISHMRLDRLRRLVNNQCVFTIFVAPPSGPTIPFRKYSNISRRLTLNIFQSFLRIPLLTTLNWLWHVIKFFHDRPSTFHTFTWMVCIGLSSRGRIRWKTFLRALWLIFSFAVNHSVDQVNFIELFWQRVTHCD